MSNMNLIKIMGYLATIGGIAASLLSDWVDDKNMEKKINECIDKKFAELDSSED